LVLRRDAAWGRTAPADERAPEPQASAAVPAILFVATAVSMVVTALAATPMEVFPGEDLGSLALLGRLWADDRARAGALAMAGTLLGILTAHEAGHYVAARIHGVPVSLPHFLPLPLISPFGTMGAVIRMPRPVRDRTKLFDIGAAGPLAGLALAIPLYAYGVSISVRVPRIEALGHGVELGSSMLSLGIERLFAPAESADTELVLSPVAFGAWGGLLLTMLNLLPVGQLDGGHVATALFGDRWARGACTVHRLMLAVFFALAVGPGLAGLFRGEPFTMIPYAGRATFWFVWAQIVAVVAASARPPSGMSGQARVFSTLALAWAGSSAAVRASDAMTGLWLVAVLAYVTLDLAQSGLDDPGLAHPAVHGAALDRRRAGLAWFTLALFALLLMPWPMAV